MHYVYKVLDNLAMLCCMMASAGVQVFNEQDSVSTCYVLSAFLFLMIAHYRVNQAAVPFNNIAGKLLYTLRLRAFCLFLSCSRHINTSSRAPAPETVFDLRTESWYQDINAASKDTSDRSCLYFYRSNCDGFSVKLKQESLVLLLNIIF